MIVCWGELLWDLFPSGACLGGAPSNVAVHLAANGERTALVTRLGRDDLGERAYAALADLGIERTGIQWDEELGTGRVGIQIRKGEPSYTLHEGAWRRIACDDSAHLLLKDARAFCYGTLSQQDEAGLQSWRAALAKLRKGSLRVCDPNLRGGRIDPDLVLEHMQAADIVKINDAEARIFQQTYACPDPIRWLLEDMQVRLVAHTHGPDGATLHTPEATEHHAGFACAAGGDNVGAGDSFTAVLVRAALRGSNLKNTAEAANRYGSFVASRRGATPAVPASLLAQIDELLASQACLAKR